MESIDGVFHRCSINEQLRIKLFNFIVVAETQSIECEAQSLLVDVEHRHFVLKAQHIAEKRAHFSCSKNKDSHSFISLSCSVVKHFYLLAHRLIMDSHKHIFHEIRTHAHLFGKFHARLDDVIVSADLHNLHTVQFLSICAYAY